LFLGQLSKAKAGPQPPWLASDQQEDYHFLLANPQAIMKGLHAPAD